MFRAIIVVALFTVFTPTLHGQEARNTGFLVHQLLVCPYSNMGEINRLSALTKPILDELVDEKFIRAWYDLRHAWGDEWNVSVITVADNQRHWLDFWSEYLRRVREKHPTYWSDFLGLCTIHKDNMYSVRDSGIDNR